MKFLSLKERGLLVQMGAFAFGPNTKQFARHYAEQAQKDGFYVLWADNHLQYWGLRSR